MRESAGQRESQQSKSPVPKLILMRAMSFPMESLPWRTQSLVGEFSGSTSSQCPPEIWVALQVDLFQECEGCWKQPQGDAMNRTCYQVTFQNRALHCRVPEWESEPKAKSQANRLATGYWSLAREAQMWNPCQCPACQVPTFISGMNSAWRLQF